jgi:thiosulfate dehydrogenase [quinone] large subunit
LESRPGLGLLPLRAFLGITFCYAGLQKLHDPGYFDKNNPGSVVGQMETLRNSSPIGWLLRISLHAPTLIGLLIAFGELAVGLALTVGFLTRVAAFGGIMLSVSFWLTVSWDTHPYFFGSDLPFLFGFTALLAMGSGGVLSLDGWLRERAVRAAKADLAIAGVPAAATALARATGRRVLLSGLGAAGVIGVFGGLLGGLMRLIRPSRDSAEAASIAPAAATPAATAAATAAARGGAVTGTLIAAVADVPVGHGKRFTPKDPADGRSAWVVQTAPGTFKAFDAICTHAGCPVLFPPGATQFKCPCHGATFDVKTGAVTKGPATKPLKPIAVQVENGQIYAD